MSWPRRGLERRWAITWSVNWLITSLLSAVSLLSVSFFLLLRREECHYRRIRIHRIRYFIISILSCETRDFRRNRPTIKATTGQTLQGWTDLDDAGGGLRRPVPQVGLGDFKDLVSGPQLTVRVCDAALDQFKDIDAWSTIFACSDLFK